MPFKILFKNQIETSSPDCAVSWYKKSCKKREKCKKFGCNSSKNQMTSYSDLVHFSSSEDESKNSK